MPKQRLDDKSWEELIKEYTGNNKLFYTWLKEKEKEGLLFDRKLINWSYAISNDLAKDFDHFIVISGKEGLGKSTLAIQLAAYIDSNFSLKRVCYDSSQFIKNLREAPKGSCIIIDEGGQTLFSREAMTLTNRMLVKSFMIMRQRNLCVIICIPNFHLLDSYIKLHRVDTLIEIVKRGKYFGVISRGIKTVAQDGAKYKNVLGLKINEEFTWFGYFTKQFPGSINRSDYIEFKEKNMMDFLDKLEEDNDFLEIKMIPASKVAKEICCHPKTIKNLIEKGEVKGKKIGRLWYVDKSAYKKLISNV